MFLNSIKDSLIQIKKPDGKSKGRGAVSKVESARVILVPNGAVLLRGGSGLDNPYY